MDDFNLLSIAERTAKALVFYMPPSWTFEDVISDIYAKLAAAYADGKFTTENEARAIAHNHLIDLFRSWSNTLHQEISWDELQEKIWKDEESGNESRYDIEDPTDFFGHLDNWSPPRRKDRNIVKVFPWDIEFMQEGCGRSLQNLRKWGYDDEEDLPLLSPRFVAALIKGLIICGISSSMARKVVDLGIRKITADTVLSNEDLITLYNFRQRAGNIEWTRTPGGVTLQTTLPNNRIEEVFIEC